MRALDSFLTVEAGAQYFSPRQGDSKALPAALLAYTQRFSYLTATASLEEGFQSNFQGVAPTGLSETRTAALLFVGNAFRSLTPSLGVRWYWQKFEQNTQSFGAANTRTTTWEVEAKVAYLIARSFSVVLGYLMTNRTSSDHTNEFLENRIQLAFSFNYDRW